jgi:Flp pilus assembly protein TadD
VRLCVLALLVCLAGGCSTHRLPDADRTSFVRRSQKAYADGATFDVPPADARSGGAMAQPSVNATPVTAAGQPPVSSPPSITTKTTSPPTIEASDSALIVALVGLKGKPTADAYVAAGSAYLRLGVLDKAESNYQHALRVDGHNAAASDGLARVWRDWGFPQYALGDAYRAVAYAPKSAAAENTLGTVLFALGDPREARAHFQKASNLDPQAVYALNNMCYVSLMLGDAAPAISRCHEALTLSPGFVAARNNLGLVYAAGGRQDLAADEFAKAGGDPAAAYNIGIVEMAKRDYRGAVPPFEAACHASPEVAGACAWATEARRLASYQAAATAVTGNGDSK